MTLANLSIKINIEIWEEESAMSNIFYRKQYKKIGSVKSGMEIVIDTPKVTRDLIEYIIEYERPRVISFTDKVKIIDENCFYHMNVDYISFNSAINVEEIRTAAFKKAFRLHCVDCFENVEKIDESAFEEAKSEDSLYMPNVKQIPSKCFKNAKFLSVIVPNAEQIADDAMDGLQVENSINV